MTIFDFVSDAAIIVVCVAAAAGCFALNRRIRRLASTERGIGKAMSEMSRSVAQFETLLVAAERSTREASAILDEQLAQARKLVARLESLASAAPRAAAREAPRRAVNGDPLSNVVPRGFSLAGVADPRGVGGPVSDDDAERHDSAEKQLAGLALRRAAAGPGVAGGLGRDVRA